ncbi:MAG: FHA domain-containing protein [Deltaproteobacteria bacterium]|nr:FHA domain-containing protein [Deltaproteobacteria bacterium]
MALTPGLVRRNMSTVREALRGLPAPQAQRLAKRLQRAEQGLNRGPRWFDFLRPGDDWHLAYLQRANARVLGVARATQLETLEIVGDTVQRRRAAALDHAARRFAPTAGDYDPRMQSVTIDIGGIEAGVAAAARGTSPLAHAVSFGAHSIDINLAGLRLSAPVQFTFARGGTGCDGSQGVEALGAEHVLVRIDDRLISRRHDGRPGHLTVTYDPLHRSASFVVQDHGSTNGPLVGATRVTRGTSQQFEAATLRGGQRGLELTIGDWPVTVVVGQGAAAAGRGRADAPAEPPPDRAAARIRRSVELREDDPVAVAERRRDALGGLDDLREAPDPAAAPLVRARGASPAVVEEGSHPFVARGSKERQLREALGGLFGPECRVKVSERDNGDIAVEVLPAASGEAGHLRISLPGDVAVDGMIEVVAAVSQHIRPFGTSARANVDVDFFRRRHYDSMVGVYQGDIHDVELARIRGSIAFAGPSGGGSLTSAWLPQVDRDGVMGSWTSADVQRARSAPPGITFNLPWPDAGYLYQHEGRWYYHRNAADAARLLLNDACARACAALRRFTRLNPDVTARAEDMFHHGRVPGVVYFPHQDRDVSAENPLNRVASALPPNARILDPAHLLPSVVPQRR